MSLRSLKGWLRRQRLRRAGVTVDLPGPVWRVGGHDGWAVRPDNLGPGSVVYSFGLGNVIAWDLAMIDRFGAVVHGFDPTPESVAWIGGQALPPRFIFHACGLAVRDGTLALYPPRKPGKFNFSQEKLEYVTAAHAPIQVPVKSLATIARELGHDRIDVLKIDIEGGEFDVLPALLASGVQVQQLLVEIHYHYPTRSFAEGVQLIQAIRRHGLRCSYISDRGLEFGFARG